MCLAEKWDFINDTEELNCFITANEDLAEGLKLDVK